MFVVTAKRSEIEVRVTQAEREAEQECQSIDAADDSDNSDEAAIIDEFVLAGRAILPLVAAYPYTSLIDLSSASFAYQCGLEQSSIQASL